MSTLTALARAEAAARNVAQPIATVCHLHLAQRPLVLIPLTLAGEANAPLAAMVGSAPETPRLLVVPQPRNRDQRFAFAAALAEVVLGYVAEHRGPTEAVPIDRGRDVRHRYVDAPQVLVPNPGGIEFLRLFGRATRFQRTDGDHPVPPSVPLLGRWLTFLAERAEHPGSCLLVAMTEALTAHWATGQSGLEDAHLGALLAWFPPPVGTPAAPPTIAPGAQAAGGATPAWTLGGLLAGALGAQAAAWAETHCPPAGPATDPEFDNTVLAPLMAAYQRAGDDARASQRAYAELESALRGQLAPTWELMWRGVSLLRTLPAGAHVATRWAEDRDAFTDHAAYVDAGGPPQPRHDQAVAAAARLHRLERAAAAYAAQRAYDDPLVMAEHRLAGEAFAGQVVLADPTRVDDSGRRPVLRPRIMVRTTDPVLVPVGAVLHGPVRPGQKARVVLVTPRDEATDVVLELSGGMGRSLTPASGSVPDVGETVCYTTLTDAFVPPAAFPDPEQTPWTHGGPPPGSAEVC